MKSIALVSGGNRGLGLETCRQLAQQGLHVLLGSRDRDKGLTAARRLRAEGLQVDSLVLDITNARDRQAVAARIDHDFARLDVLINNAGMLSSEENFFSQSVRSVRQEVLQQTFAVNFFATVALTQELLPLLQNSTRGRIVNVSSMLGSMNLHSDNPPWLQEMKPFAYDASKAALNQFTIHLAAALQSSPIKVNSAHPGWVRTALGTDRAPMDAATGAKTLVRLAMLPEEGPSGGFFHLGKRIPW